MDNTSSPVRNLTFVGLLIISLFSLFYCYDYLLQISISVFLPEIKVSFNLSDFQLGLIGSTFFITYVLLQVPGGYLIDRLGPWHVAFWMSMLCSLGALLMYFSVHSYYLLLLSRLFIGLGSSVSFLAAISIISLYSPVRHFSLFIGVLQALAGVGAMSGQTPVAYLNKYYAWNHISLFFFVVALAFVLFFLLLMRKSNGHSHFQQHHAKKIDKKTFLAIIQDKRLINISLLSFISWSPVASLAGFWLVQYLHVVSNMNTVNAGFILSTFWSGLIIGSIVIPLISEWHKRRKPVLLFGFVLQFFAVLVIILIPTYAGMLAIALFALGFMSPIQGFCVVLLKDMSPASGFGVASGVINMFGTISGGIMQFVIGFLLSYIFSDFVNPYAWSFGAYLFLSVLGFYLCLTTYKESHPLRQAKVAEQEN